MNVLEHMMHLYDEALEELMGAEKYTKCMEKSESAEDKSMYRGLAKQELEHESMLEKSADRLFTAGSSDPMHTVWHHLKKHLHGWRAKIEMRMNET